MLRATINVRIDRGAVRAMLTKVDGPVGRDIRTRAERVQAEARRLVGVRTGALRDSIYVRMVLFEGAPTAIVGSDLHYARWHHDGTGIYGPTHAPIVPKRHRYLRFPVDGRYVFARSVKGSPGTHFLTRALPAAGDHWTDAITAGPSATRASTPAWAGGMTGGRSSPSAGTGWQSRVSGGRTARPQQGGWTSRVTAGPRARQQSGGWTSRITGGRPAR